MSAIISGRVYWSNYNNLSYKNTKGKKINIKEQTAKLVMLAIADSSDDYGENSWNSFDTLAQKASIERRSVVRVCHALVESDRLKFTGTTQYGTNNFSINLALLGDVPPKRARNGRPRKLEAIVKTGDSGAKTGDSGAKTGDSESSDPSLNRPDPSLKRARQKRATPKTITPVAAEIELFREVVKHYPNKEVYEQVINAIQAVGARLRREVTKDDLLPYFKHWCTISNNTYNLAWLLEWAVPGKIRTYNGNGKTKVAEAPPPNGDDFLEQLAKHKQALATENLS